MPSGPIAKSPSKQRGSERARMLVRRARTRAQSALDEEKASPVRSPRFTPDKPISTAGSAPAMKRRPQHASRLFA